MKKLFIVILGFFLMACGEEAKQATQEATSESIIETEENYLERYPNGLKKIEGKLINGQRHGIWTYYYENGMKWSEGKYKRGVRDGFSIVYYENGRKKLVGDYKNDLKIGIWKVWNDDGSLAAEVDLNEKLSAADSLKLEMK
jgi:antitoxin component YwqK of YwqJK toxin-antitoxin module